MAGKKPKSAKIIIDEFFLNLKDIPGFDRDTAKVINNLWKGKKLGQDELLSSLEKLRKKGD